MELPILYEDADIVAVNKPAGLLTHPSAVSSEETAQDIIAKKFPGAEYVHRLDKDTSGVLVFAKNNKAHAFLREAFTDRGITKTYLAIVHGVLTEKRGVIDFDIGRSRKDFRMRSAQPRAKGTLRQAVTNYQVIGEDATRTHSLVKLEPQTGRTHQIRVHLKAIHHPIVADILYGAKGADTLGLPRMALHAYSIVLPLLSGERLSITAPVPKDLHEAFARFPQQEYV